jgi:L-ascorbate metabolism protein UlaG (beta-lactamase superfamily)
MRKLVFALLFTAGAALSASPEEFATSAGPLQIVPIQHASLILKAGGKVMYVDPAQGSYEGLPAADYILITDIHGDHMVPSIVDKLRKPGAVILAPKAVAPQITGTTVISNGESKTVGPFQVEAVPMYNLTPERQQYHPKGRGNGYVVTFGGKRFYFSGDTEGIPEMRTLKNVDVAFVCMNLPYTMTPQEASEAIRVFHPSVVYPYHYRGQDVGVLAKALAGTGIDVRLRDWYGK